MRGGEGELAESVLDADHGGGKRAVVKEGNDRLGARRGVDNGSDRKVTDSNVTGWRLDHRIQEKHRDVLVVFLQINVANLASWAPNQRQESQMEESYGIGSISLSFAAAIVITDGTGVCQVTL